MASRPPAAPALLPFLLAFLEIGLSGVGGVMPFARRVLVDRRAWLTASEFADLLGLCQLAPGPNICNLATVLGARWHGAAGAVLAPLALVLPPVALVLLLDAALAGLPAGPTQHALAGLGAGAAGLLAATALRMLAALRERPRLLPAAAAATLGISGFGLPMPVVLLALLPPALLLAARPPRA